MIILICTLSFVYPNQQGLILKNSICLKPKEESWVFSCLGWCLRLIELCRQNNGFMPILDRCSCLNENGCDPCPAYEPLGSKTAAISFMAAKTNPSQEDCLHFSPFQFTLNHVFSSVFASDLKQLKATYKLYSQLHVPTIYLKYVYWYYDNKIATLFLNYISQLNISITFPIRVMALHFLNFLLILVPDYISQLHFATLFLIRVMAAKSKPSGGWTKSKNSTKFFWNVFSISIPNIIAQLHFANLFCNSISHHGYG